MGKPVMRSSATWNALTRPPPHEPGSATRGARDLSVRRVTAPIHLRPPQPRPEDGAVVDGPLYAAFLVAAMLLTITPGPDLMFVLVTGIRGGPRVGIVAVLGVAAGLVVHTVAAVLGLSALFSALPPLYAALRWCGAAYLVYLAVSAFRDRAVLPSPATPADGSAASVPPPRQWRAFRQAVVTNVLNPKVILFNVAFLPQFVNPSMGHVGVQFLVLGLTFIGLGLVVDGSVALAAGRVGSVLQRSRRFTRALNVVSGTVFAGLAARLALLRD